MNSGVLFLTSAGFFTPVITQKYIDLTNSRNSNQVAIITTASEEKENNKYSQLARKQFLEMGFSNVDFVDLETEPDKDLTKYDVIYVCGGNTFKLLKFARESNFKPSIENLLKRNGIYIGVSAGTVLVGPSIEIADEVEPDPNDVGLTDLMGLNITELVIHPHYIPEVEDEIIAFEKRHNVKVERLANSQAVLIENNQTMIIE